MKLHIVVTQLPALEYRAHKRPCTHCPSAYGPGDPESEWVLTLPHDKRVALAFPCGWNGKRFCRGYCDVNGVTDDDLVAARHLFR